MEINMGQYLKGLREKAGMAQRDVSKAFGYGSPQFISNWERNLAMPPVESLKKLAALYKADAQEIFDRYEKATLERINKTLMRKFKISSKRS